MRISKPLAAWLPGKYGKMTRAQLDAESDQYDTEFSGVDAFRKPNARPHFRDRFEAWSALMRD